MNTAILHYSAPPVVGGVEAVMLAHTSLMLKTGFRVRIIAGVGEQAAFPQGAEFILIPEMDSRHPEIVEASRQLETGSVPANFESLSTNLEEQLEAALASVDNVIIHNVFSKHFNLPLTAALMHLLDQGKIAHCIAWCHDFSWTSPHSRPSVHPGFPWDLLRTQRTDVVYVTVSQERQADLAGLFHCPPEKIGVVYNGVDPAELYGLSGEARVLIDCLHINEANLILLMPVRITQAKNIEFAFQVIAILKREGLRPRLVVTGPPDPHDPGDMQYYQQLLDLRKSLQVEYEARFVYECSPDSGEGYTIGTRLVGELYRVCDALFMPSHREGFGMPVVEAGLIGLPIFSAQIPAAQEIGASEIKTIVPAASAEDVAQMLLDWASEDRTHRLRQRIRQKYTWQAIFHNDILPLLSRG